MACLKEIRRILENDGYIHGNLHPRNLEDNLPEEVSNIMKQDGLAISDITAATSDNELWYRTDDRELFRIELILPDDCGLGDLFYTDFTGHYVTEDGRTAYFDKWEAGNDWLFYDLETEHYISLYDEEVAEWLRQSNQPVVWP